MPSDVAEVLRYLDTLQESRHDPDQSDGERCRRTHFVMATPYHPQINHHEHFRKKTKGRINILFTRWCHQFIFSRDDDSARKHKQYQSNSLLENHNSLFMPRADGHKNKFWQLYHVTSCRDVKMSPSLSTYRCSSESLVSLAKPSVDMWHI